MLSPPPSFFERLEDRLNLAIYDINESHRMGLREIKQALRGHPDRYNLDLIGDPRSKASLELGEQTVEIGRRDTAADIRAKLNPQPEPEPEPFVAPLGFANLEPIERPMSILGLESGLFEKKMAEIRRRVADKHAASLVRIDGSVDAGITKIDQAADTVVAKVEAEVDAQIQEFAKFGDNGGPA